ncbi:hypothetical protein GCM10009596_10060 [Arthrobacter rhombi]
MLLFEWPGDTLLNISPVSSLRYLEISDSPNLDDVRAARLLPELERLTFVDCPNVGTSASLNDILDVPRISIDGEWISDFGPLAAAADADLRASEADMDFWDDDVSDTEVPPASPSEMLISEYGRQTKSPFGEGLVLDPNSFIIEDGDQWETLPDREAIADEERTAPLRRLTTVRRAIWLQAKAPETKHLISNPVEFFEFFQMVSLLSAAFGGGDDATRVSHAADDVLNTMRTFDVLDEGDLSIDLNEFFEAVGKAAPRQANAVRRLAEGLHQEVVAKWLVSQMWVTANGSQQGETQHNSTVHKE